MTVRRTIRLLPFVVLAFLTPSTLASEPIATSELLAILDAQLDAMDGQQLKCVMNEWSGQGTSAPPERTEDDDSFKLRTEFSCVRDGSKYRIENTTVDTCPSLFVLMGQQQVLTSNGAHARAVKRHKKESVRISQPNPAFHRRSQVFNWLGWNVLNLPKPMTYADILRAGVFDGPRQLPSGETRWRCTVGCAEPCLEIDFFAKREGPARLSRVEVRGYESDVDVRRAPDTYPDDARMVVLQTVEFSSAQADVNGTSIPVAATVKAHHFRKIASEEFWGEMQVNLTEIEPVQIDETTFVEPVQSENAAIIDHRYRISYQLGESEINVDGRLLKTHCPVYGNVGDELAWWIERGNFNVVFDPHAKIKRDD